MPDDKVYSQGLEQEAILAAVRGHEKGRVLDIGAADGVTFSNSRALIEAGWSGVLVEASPDQFLKLIDLYRETDRVTLVNAAVGLDWGLPTFWHTLDLVSTTVIEHHGRWHRTAAYDATYRVAQVPMRTILDEFWPVDVVTIDVEGASAELIVPLIAHGEPRPSVIVIEHDNMVAEIRGWTQPHGYRHILQNAENLVLVR